MPYTYAYPRPMVTVDVILIQAGEADAEVLLIQRKHPPFQNRWALPGGYVDIEEPLEAAAHRELAEETGVANLPLVQTGVAGEPGRDPRGRTISVIFTGFVPRHQKISPAGGDDARQARWFALKHLPPLAFDHQQLLHQQLTTIRFCALYKLWLLEFLRPQPFTIKDVQQLQSLLIGDVWSPAVWEAVLMHLPFLTRDGNTFLWKDTAPLFSCSDVFWMEFWGKRLSQNLI
ncbi:MAG: NUDIX hydrolase [Calditrichaeota bacterium]|nr:NUDIX hydrolase [Calditrichota bacterium]